MIGVDLERKLMCPQCRKYSWHLSTISVDREENLCRSCDWVWAVEYETPSPLYSQIVEHHLQNIRDAVSSAMYNLNTHNWSVNLGKKDKRQLELIGISISHALRLLNTFIKD